MGELEEIQRLMDSTEERLDALETVVVEHGKRDEDLFATVTSAIAGLKAEIAKLAATIDDALASNSARAGLLERVRTLERTELDRKWAIRIIIAAVLTQAVVMAFRIFAGKVTP
jgi:hypothetical protein